MPTIGIQDEFRDALAYAIVNGVFHPDGQTPHLAPDRIEINDDEPPEPPGEWTGWIGEPLTERLIVAGDELEPLIMNKGVLRLIWENTGVGVYEIKYGRILNFINGGTLYAVGAKTQAIVAGGEADIKYGLIFQHGSVIKPELAEELARCYADSNTFGTMNEADNIQVYDNVGDLWLNTIEFDSEKWTDPNQPDEPGLARFESAIIIGASGATVGALRLRADQVVYVEDNVTPAAVGEGYRVEFEILLRFREIV
jgi:hypothetical protein